MQLFFSKYLRKSLLFIILFGLVLVVNLQVILFDMMYVEQPILYLANQKIQHLTDLLNIYLYPKLLHVAVPFFRPSGHFLLYQLLIPLFGWHNTRALIVVNLLFLALTGYFMIKLYRLLFPRLKSGGYLAFSFYLMHPALCLSRFTIMHFEFAYVFFTTMAIYYFVLFCKVNLNDKRTVTISELTFHSFWILACSLCLFIVAATFKEAAVMVGPVCILYLCISLFQSKEGIRYIFNIIKNQNIRHIISLLFIVSLTMFVYLTLAWPQFSHPVMTNVNLDRMILAVNEFIKFTIGTNYNFFTINKTIVFNSNVWRQIHFPIVNKVLTETAFLITFVVSLLLITKRAEKTGSDTFQKETKRNLIDYRKSYLFLFIASLIFLILPIGWAMANPWHLSLTLLCLSLIFGFSFEYLFNFISYFQSIRKINFLIYILALIVALTTILVNKSYINMYDKLYDKKTLIIFKTVRNAVHHAPHIEGLNENSLIVIEDSAVHNDYVLGNSAYPMHLYRQININFDYDHFAARQSWNFIQFKPHYNGTMFKWAYLLPRLREELYPFKIKEMNEVPDAMIYNWLKNYEVIFCLGYDERGHWHDLTKDFKINLQQEKLKRHLIVNSYQKKISFSFKADKLFFQNLAFPDPQLCEQICDQNVACDGFNYILAKPGKYIIQCQFYNFSAGKNMSFCPSCIAYEKKLV